MKKKFIHRKELLSLGLKNTHISTIITYTDNFKEIPKQHGYAIEFDFNHALLISLGCELLSLGISTRNVEMINCSLDSNYPLRWIHVDDNGNVKKTVTYFDPLRQRISAKIKQPILILSSQDDPLKTIVKPKTGGEFSRKKRTTLLSCMVFPEGELSNMTQQMDVFIIIKLYSIIEKVKRLFR